MFQEDFIASKWFNTTFSELLNYDLVQNPVEDWFLWPTATLKKRPWLWTDVWPGWEYLWQADAKIMGKHLVWWVSFMWDEECNIYRFEKIAGNLTLTKVFDNSVAEDYTIKTQDMYGNRMKQKAINVPYLSKHVKSWTADKLLSLNDDGSWNVVLVVNEANTFSASSVWQYIYFTNSASSNSRWQIRQIVELVDDKTVYLNQMFYWDPIDWEIDEPWETYETIDQVVVFNNIRNDDWLVLCVWVNDNEAHARNLWWIDIEIFEWRYWHINSYWTSIWGSIGSWEYEILDPDTIRWSSLDSRWQRMNSLVLTKNYLLVNQETSISVVRQIAATADNDPIYNLNSIINWSASFSPEAIHYKWWLYYLWQDIVFEWWDIVAVSTNLIYWETKNQWEIIQRYLDRIESWDFVSTYNYGRWVIIQHVKDWKTYILYYDSVYEWWLPQEYNLEIYDKFEQFYWEHLICVWDKVCLRKWESDLWENIKVKVVVTWSKQYVNSLFSIKKIKLWLWYYWNIVKFKIRLDLWYAVFEWKVEKDANWVEYLVWQNIAGQQPWLWLIPFGFWNIWWWNSLNEYIAKVWLLGIPIWKKCSYYKLSIENIDNFDLNITGISVLTEWWNPYITPANNVF